MFAIVFTHSQQFSGANGVPKAYQKASLGSDGRLGAIWDVPVDPRASQGYLDSQACLVSLLFEQKL